MNAICNISCSIRNLKFLHFISLNVNSIFVINGNKLQVILDVSSLNLFNSSGLLSITLQASIIQILRSIIDLKSSSYYIRCFLFSTFTHKRTFIILVKNSKVKTLVFPYQFLGNTLFYFLLHFLIHNRMKKNIQWVRR